MEENKIKIKPGRKRKILIKTEKIETPGVDSKNIYVSEAQVEDIKPDIHIITEVGVEDIENSKKVSISTIKSDDIQWFTEVDYNSKREIAANYPAWYFDVQLNELNEEIHVLEQGIEDGFYEARFIKEARKKLKEKKERYNIILEGKPKISGMKKDEVYRAVQEFEKSILDSKFTWEECWNVKKHHADAHEEARRMVTPCIKVTNRIVADFAKQAGMRMENGKISRNDAINACAVLAKSIGEQINVDYR